MTEAPANDNPGPVDEPEDDFPPADYEPVPDAVVLVPEDDDVEPVVPDINGEIGVPADHAAVVLLPLEEDKT